MAMACGRVGLHLRSRCDLTFAIKAEAPIIDNLRVNVNFLFENFIYGIEFIIKFQVRKLSMIYY